MKEHIKKEIVKYDLTAAKIAKIKKAFMPLKVASITDMENYVKCRDAHLKTVKVRTNIEKIRKELKSGLLEDGRDIDNEAKRLTSVIGEIESHLLIQRKVVEDEQFRLQQAKALKELEEEARIKKEEEDRIEKVRLDQEQKAKELKAQQDKIDADKKVIEDQKETNRLEKERLAKEKQDGIDAKKKAEQDEIERKEREAVHALEVEEAKKTAAEKAIKEEQDRAKKEKEAKELADFKRKEEELEAKKKASDKDKLLELRSDISCIELPDVQSKKSKKLLEDVNLLLEKAWDILTEGV